MRISAVLSVLLAVIGCSGGSGDSCIPLLGPCPSGPGEVADTVRVYGFPSSAVNGSVGTLHVGQSVTLHLIQLNALPPADTVRAVAWGLPTGVTAFQLASGNGGAGVLAASAPGSLSQVIANAAARSVWSCASGACTQLSQIVAVP